MTDAHAQAQRTALDPALDALVARVRDLDDWWHGLDFDVDREPERQQYWAAIREAKSSALDQILAVMALSNGGTS